MKELQRLATLHETGLLDTPDSEDFDRITRIASAALGAPIALVSLVDADRQWFKAAHGLDARETPREHSFCAHAIQGDGIMVVPDAREDSRFRNNPLVTGDPKIAFYAGAPLVTKDGHALGTLCVIDSKPRPELDETGRQLLTDLAASAMQEIERRQRDIEMSRMALVTDELKHRMGNVYALVSALVSRLDKTVEDKDAFVSRLREKISSLARAQALLAANQLRQAPMVELASTVLEPLCPDRLMGRVTLLGGPPLQLSPHGAFIITLMLGELGANAVKHGALATEAGTVELSWREEGENLFFEWRERSPGRPGVADSGTGFGAKILRQIVPLDLKGEAEWIVADDGFEYRLTAKRSRVVASDEDPAGG